MMGWIIKLFPGLAPYEFALKLLGALAIILSLMAAGAILMHDRDEAAYQAERARSAEAAKSAQDKAIAAAISQQEQDYVRAARAADDLHRQQLAAANTRLAAAQDSANNAEAYACKLGAAGFQIELEAFK